jgi:hypothetical protein
MVPAAQALVLLAVAACLLVLLHCHRIGSWLLSIHPPRSLSINGKSPLTRRQASALLPFLPVFAISSYTGSPSPGASAWCPFLPFTMTESTTAKASSNGNTTNGNDASGEADAIQATLTTPGQGVTAIAAAEKANAYTTFGPAYVGTGIVGDLSVEIGFSTGTDGQQQRSGIGLYLRSDHVAHRYAAQLFI